MIKKKIEAVKNDIETVVKRFKSPTPKFWKKVRNLMITIGTISGALLMLPVTAGIVIPATIMTAATHGAIIGVIGSSLSQMTKEDNIKPKTEAVKDVKTKRKSKKAVKN